MVKSAPEEKEQATEVTSVYSHSALNHARVYLCYVEDDEALTQRLCDYFQAKGTPCWFAKRDLSASMAWPQSLLEAIEACSSVVVVLTDRANSAALRPELEEAKRHGRQMLVLKATVDPIQPDLDLLLYGASWFDLTMPLRREVLEAVWAQLLEMETGAFFPDGDEDEVREDAQRPTDLKSAKSYLVRLEARSDRIHGRLSAELSEGQRLIIGRDLSADVVVKDHRASRRHAGFVVERNGAGALELQVSDLMSANGTWVRLPRKGDAPMSRHLKHGLIRITDGAMLRIGSTDIRVRCAPVPTVIRQLG